MVKGSSTRAPKDPFPDIPSFFKIMFGDDFSEALFLPPRVARTVSNLINKKFVLEDANGLMWSVTLSKNKGSLAFGKGWNEFSVDHGLKIGDFVVFKIIKKAHFLVTIFGRSACEELSFPKINGNKRNRKRTNVISSEKSKNCSETDSPEINDNKRRRKGTVGISNENLENCREKDSDNVNVQQSNSSVVSVPSIEVNKETPMIMNNTSNTDDRNNLMIVSKSNLVEEPFFMINRDVGVEQGETRDSLYDLASIEMSPCDVSGIGKRVPENERFQQCNDEIPNLETEVRTVVETPVAKEVQSCLPIPEVPKFETTRKSTDNGKIERGAHLANNDSKSKIAQEQFSYKGSGKETISVYRRQHMSTKMSGHNATNKFVADLEASLKLGASSSETGKSLKQVKQEQVEMKEACISGEISGKSSKQVKQEQIEITEEACVHGGKPGKSFHVVEQGKVERKQEDFVQGGLPGYQWMMKLDEFSNPSVEVNNQVPLMVKAEPVDTVDFISDVAVKLKIPDSDTPDKQPYLELPDSLVPRASRTRTKPRSLKTFVIYLRGPKTGLSMWPVLYLEKPGHKLLTSGWDAFRKANSISPGDECIFKREDQYELIFRVTVLPK